MTSADRPAGHDRAWSWFFAWLGVGLTYAGALVSALTISIPIGVLVLVIAATLTALLARNPSSIAGVGGAVAATAVGPLAIAYANRRGPGMYCVHDALTSTCESQQNPVGPLLLGGALIALGVVVTVMQRRRPGQTGPDAGSSRSAAHARTIAVCVLAAVIGLPLMVLLTFGLADLLLILIGTIRDL